MGYIKFFLKKVFLHSKGSNDQGKEGENLSAIYLTGN
jgi:hypothetical protein